MSKRSLDERIDELEHDFTKLTGLQFKVKHGSNFHYALKSMIKSERQEQIEADFLRYRKELHAVEGYSTDEQDLIRVRNHQLRELENEL